MFFFRIILIFKKMKNFYFLFLIVLTNFWETISLGGDFSAILNPRGEVFLLW
jgi:hypothetical protein